MKEKVFCYLKNQSLKEKLSKIYKHVDFVLCLSKEKLLNFCRKSQNSIVFIEDELELLSEVKYSSGIYVVYFTHDQQGYLEAMKIGTEDVIFDYSDMFLKAISIRYYVWRPFKKTSWKIRSEGHPFFFSSQEIYFIEMCNREVAIHTYDGVYNLGLHAFGKDQKFLYDHYFRQVRKGIYVNLMQVRGYENNTVVMGDNSCFRLTRTYKSEFERDYEGVRAALTGKK